MRFLRFLFAIGALGCQSASFPSGDAPPNIIFILADDLGYHDLGCYGGTSIRTPNIDRLAAQGIRLTDFYMASCVCTPSRSAILTGRYPYRNGLYEMIRNDLADTGHRYTEEEYAVSPEMTLGMDEREITVAQILKARGYATGIVGKWDGGRARRFLPLRRGFDFYYGFANTGIDYWTHERYGVPSLFRGNERIREEGYATRLFGREAVRFIRENRERPFFLYAAFNAPHIASNLEKDRWQAPEDLLKLYGETPSKEVAKYSAMVTSLDEEVGRIVRTLEELGLTKKTLVVFTNDNGGEKITGNAPLRGFKSQLFEGGVRVPFVASWPERIPAGKVSGAVASAMDFVPTFAALSGASLPRGVVYDGQDLSSILFGRSDAGRAELFWEWRGAKAARAGSWKWVKPRDAEPMLFDLSADVGETRDLSKEKPDVAADLAARWTQWRKEMEASEPRGPFRDY